MANGRTLVYTCNGPIDVRERMSFHREGHVDKVMRTRVGLSATTLI
jgi:hypothetical protein